MIAAAPSNMFVGLAMCEPSVMFLQSLVGLEPEATGAQH